MRHHLLIAGLCLLLAAPALAEVKLEIGPDTTVIDGPVNPDGTINYLAYLNEKLSEGVTPENNFAVDVARVMPPDTWPNEAFREKVFSDLGIVKPPKGPYFVQFRLFEFDGNVQPGNADRLPRLNEAIDKPWTAEQYPDVKQWLDAQVPALDQIRVALTKKDRQAFPLVVEEGQPQAFSMALLPWLGQVRGLARGFKARAEWHIAKGELDVAWEDLMAMHRLADLTTMDANTISYLVGLSIHNMAAPTVRDFAASPGLTGESARNMIADARQLGDFKPYYEFFDTAERLMALDMLMHYWKGRGDDFPRDDGDGLAVFFLPRHVYERMESEDFDPNPTMIAVNEWVDRWVSAGRIPSYSDRMAALHRLDEESKRRAQIAYQVTQGNADAIQSMRRELDVHGLNVAVATPMFIHLGITGNQSVFRAEAVTRMRLSLIPLALAIGGYHAEHGEYPPDLHALVPAYLDGLPTDFATGKLPVYRVEDGAAIVYSLGTDLEDDGGVDDPSEGDIVFRIER